MRLILSIFLIFISLNIYANRFYKKALANYQIVELDKALENLDDAVNRVENDKDTLILIYELKAKILVGLSKNNLAKQQYLKILFLDNDYNLNKNESPKVLDFFREIKKEFLEALKIKLELPKISLQPKKMIKFTKNYSLNVNISNMNSSRDAKIHYRTLGQIKYKKSDLNNNKNDTYQGYIPLSDDYRGKNFVIEYYISVSDFMGNTISTLPNSSKPFLLKVEKSDLDLKELKSSDSIFKKWWFWTGVGVVLVGAGTGVYFLTR